MLALLRLALGLWGLLEILRATDPLTIPADRPRRERTEQAPPRTLPQATTCPRCAGHGDVTELLMSATAVYCTRCGLEMPVHLDLPECGLCHQAPAVIEFDGRAVCLPCRVFVLG